MLLSVQPASAEDGERTGYPRSVAAAGDSATTAALAGELAREVWRNSWATGDNPQVQSHYLRILARNAAVQGHVFNAAVSGQRMVHLLAQAERVVAARPDYVVLLMGANDVCASAEDRMPPVEAFRAQFQAAMEVLSRGLPEARLYIVSIPDVYRLWEVMKEHAPALFLWSLLGHCQTMLANPTSLAAADEARRDRVRQRTRDYNQQLAEVCSHYIHCRYDGGALFSYAFRAEDVSSFDFFHPSEVGQRQMARVSWEAAFDFTDAVAPTSGARMSARPDGVQVELSATDDVWVAGIEYRDTPDTWRRYDAPLVLKPGTALTFRAVDVNGNVEAARTVVAEAPPGEGLASDGMLGPHPPQGGCGCSGLPGPAVLWGVLVGVWPWLLRRRAQPRRASDGALG